VHSSNVTSSSREAKKQDFAEEDEGEVAIPSRRRRPAGRVRLRDPGDIFHNGRLI